MAVIDYTSAQIEALQQAGNDVVTMDTKTSRIKIIVGKNLSLLVKGWSRNESVSILSHLSDIFITLF